MLGTGDAPTVGPPPLQEAMARGSVTAHDIESYLKIASTPVLGAACRALPFIRDRVMGNPRFLLVLAIEEVIGVTAKTLAEVQGRKDDFWRVRLLAGLSLGLSQC